MALLTLTTRSRTAFCWPTNTLAGVKRHCSSCSRTPTPDFKQIVAGTLSILLLLAASAEAAPTPAATDPSTLGEVQRVRRSQVTLDPHDPCNNTQQFVTSMTLTEGQLLNYIQSLLDLTLEFMNSAKQKGDAIISELGTICTSEMQPLLPITTFDTLRGLNTTAALEESYRLIVVHANHTDSLRRAQPPHPRHPGNMLRDMADHLQSVMCHTREVARQMRLTPNFQEAANLGLQDQRLHDLVQGSVQLVKSCQLAKSVATLTHTFSTYLEHLKSVPLTP